MEQPADGAQGSYSCATMKSRKLWDFPSAATSSCRPHRATDGPRKRGIIDIVLATADGRAYLRQSRQEAPKRISMVRLGQGAGIEEVTGHQKRSSRSRAKSSASDPGILASACWTSPSVIVGSASAAMSGR